MSKLNKLWAEFQEQTGFRHNTISDWPIKWAEFVLFHSNELTEELARKIADIIKAHETSYAQRESDLWRWACTCGKLETVNSRDACVSATQHHWGQAVASLLREAEGRWIPVSERLPEDETTVLVSHTNVGRHVWFGKWDGEVWRRSDNLSDDDKLHTTVTHWQPLPAPPREGEAAP